MHRCIPRLYPVADLGVYLHNEYGQQQIVQYAVLFAVSCHTPHESPMYQGQARCLSLNAWGISHV
jgi:hypothetical protein